MNKRIYLLSSCLLALIAAPIAVSADTVQTNQTAVNTQQQQQQLQSDLTNVVQQKMLVQDEIAATTEKMQELNQQITQSITNIQQKENEITDLQNKLTNLDKEDKTITSLLKSREQGFSERVASYYRTDGQMSFLSVIFSIHSFGDFIDHFVAYETIVDSDKKFIEEYISDQNTLANNKKNVQAIQQSAIKEKEELETIKTGQENDKKEKETLTTLLQQKEKQLEQEEQQKRISLQLLLKNGQAILDIINNNTQANPANIQMINSIIAPFVPDAQKLQQVKGIPASITLGQIILESSGSFNGLSGLAFEAKNLFGIKGTGTAGSINMPTTEYVNGQPVTTIAQFASYKTYYDSMLAHANLLLTPRYQQYLRNVTNIVDYANGLQEAGYATDPYYSDKLLKIIYQYDLWKLDVGPY